jgi:hypothetical protein
MGFELHRAPVEFSLHLEEPVALFDAPFILVHEHLRGGLIICWYSSGMVPALVYRWLPGPLA